jgi:CubicO group peptidase (beta-lactamase class C family)
MPLAPYPAAGTYEDGYQPVANVFAAQLARGEEVGAGLTIYHRGRCVVDLWGGIADAERGILWGRDTRVVLFSATKGLASMGLALLADRGKLDYDAPVATYWPGFARAGKGAITVRTLLNHRAGLLGLDSPVSMDDCTVPSRHARLVEALEAQRPIFEPNRSQGYHAITFGMYARELFERIAGEPLGPFLAREILTPLDADVSLGTDASFDGRMARLYPPDAVSRVSNMLKSVIRTPDSTESRAFFDAIARDSMVRRAFLNPRVDRTGIRMYESIPVRRAALAWASATGSAHGLARAYLPFASGGTFEGKTYVRSATLEPLYTRQGWSQRDLVLQKPLGWSQGFLKEETQVFSPHRESFGHPGMGGALGWCDPVSELTIGYALNALDWRVRSPRAIALCRALYSTAPVRDEVHARA